MTKQDRISFLGIEIDNLCLNGALSAFEKSFANNEGGFVVTPNAAHIVMLQRDKEFKKAYQNASYVLADGFSIILASKLLGNPIEEKCSGSDLFVRLIEIAYKSKKKIFLLGGINGSEKMAQSKIETLYPMIKLISYSPPVGFDVDDFETKKIINAINNFGTDLLFVCVGAPKSEKWLDRNMDKLKINLAFSLGASIEFFVGKKMRAPSWVQRAGFEWFFRLIQEPKRLWRRYIIGNTVFLWLVFTEFFRSRLSYSKLNG